MLNNQPNQQQALAEMLAKMQASLNETEQLISQTKVTLSEDSVLKEKTIQSTRVNNQDIIKSQNRFLDDKKESQIIKSTLIGVGTGLAGAALIVGTAGLAAPAAIGLFVGLGALGGLAGAGVGLTIEVIKEVSRLKPEDFANYCAENPTKATLFCFAGGLAFNCIALGKLGYYAYEKVKEFLGVDLAAANGINFSELNSEKKKDFSLFVDEVANITTLYEKNSMHINQFLETAKRHEIFGSAFTQWSIDNYGKSKALIETIGQHQDNLYRLARQATTIKSQIEQAQQLVSNSNQYEPNPPSHSM